MSEQTEQPADDNVETIEPEIENLRLSLENAEAADQADAPGAGPAAGGNGAREGEYIAAGDRFDNNVKMIAQAIEIAFRTVAMLKGRDHWEVSAEEAKNAAVPTAQVIQKYFGDIDIGPELSLALEFSVLIGTRMMLDAKLDQVNAQGGRNAPTDE